MASCVRACVRVTWYSSNIHHFESDISNLNSTYIGNQQLGESVSTNITSGLVYVAYLHIHQDLPFL